jgi:hypothetical protein
MTKHNDNWYTADDLSAWDRVKAAFKNDWEQTKSDFGSDSARDMDQDVPDTVKQAVGADNAFENREQAFRFGYAARARFGDRYPTWSDELDSELRQHYSGPYADDAAYIRHGYNYPRS